MLGYRRLMKNANCSAVLLEIEWEVCVDRMTKI